MAKACLETVAVELLTPFYCNVVEANETVIWARSVMFAWKLEIKKTEKIRWLTRIKMTLK
jgi:hypothetical protein